MSRGRAPRLQAGSGAAPSLPRAVPVPMLLVGSRLPARSGGGFMAGSKPRLVLGRGMCAQSEPEILERSQLLVHRGVRREGSTAEVLSFFLPSLEASPLPSPCKGSGEGIGDEGSKLRVPKGPCVGAVPGWAHPASLQGAGGLWHRRQKLPLIIRSDESLLGEE